MGKIIYIFFYIQRQIMIFVFFFLIDNDKRASPTFEIWPETDTEVSKISSNIRKPLNYWEDTIMADIL